jgi:hypothetical protein
VSKSFKQDHDKRKVIWDSLPMSLDQMRVYIQKHYGVPIAFRRLGTTTIVCCLEMHDHIGSAGHYVAGCDMTNQYNRSGIVIGQRHFDPGYGYKIYEFKERE